MRALLIVFLALQLARSAHAANVSALSSMNRASLGDGYDSTQQRFLAGQCLKPEVTTAGVGYTGGALGNVHFSQVANTEKLQADFGMDVNARARFGVFKINAATHFLQTTLEDKYSVTATFEFTLSLKDARLSIAPDPNLILQPAVRDRIRDPASFRQVCGDEVVTRVERGARLYISIRATFLDHQAKQEFAAKVNLRQAFNSLSIDTKKLSATTRKHGAISISALQLGGDPRNLAEVFGRTKDAAPFPILNCSLERLDECKAALASAIKYASGAGKSSFRASVEAVYDPTKPDSGLADISYHTSPWSDLGIGIRPTPFNQERDTLLAGLVTRFDKQRKYAQRIEDLLYEGRFPLCENVRQSISELRVTVEKNLATIAKAADVCYSATEDLSDCRKASQGIDMTTLSVDESQLKPSPCFSCGRGCDDCYELNGKPTCLSCTRSVSDFLKGDLSLARNHTSGKPMQQLIDTNKIPGIVCSGMPADENVSVTVTGRIGVGFPSGEGIFFIQYRLIVPGQINQISEALFSRRGSDFVTAPRMSVPARTDAQGKLVAGVLAYCNDPGANPIPSLFELPEFKLPDCSVRFAPDFQIKIEATELKKQLSR